MAHARRLALVRRAAATGAFVGAFAGVFAATALDPLAQPAPLRAQPPGLGGPVSAASPSVPVAR